MHKQAPGIPAIECICDFLNGTDQNALQEGSINFHMAGDATTAAKELTLRCVEIMLWRTTTRKGSMAIRFGANETIRSSKLRNVLKRSLRGKLARAAAAAWAVFHLCGTPWLRGDIFYEEAFQSIQLRPQETLHHQSFIEIL